MSNNDAKRFVYPSSHSREKHDFWFLACFGRDFSISLVVLGENTGFWSLFGADSAVLGPIAILMPYAGFAYSSAILSDFLGV